MEISFCELRQKEVINVCDGKRLGRIIDMVISLTSSKVLGIVVPGNRRIFNTREDIFIPWRNIQKIGSDVLLVNLTISTQEITDKKCCNKSKSNKNSSMICGEEDCFTEEVEFTLDDE